MKSRRVVVPPGRLVLDLLKKEAPSFPFPCGGKGRCGACRCRCEGSLTAPGSRERARLGEEELVRGIRLACQARAGEGPALVHVEDGSTPEIWSRRLVSDETPPSTFHLALDLGTTSLCGELRSGEDERPWAEGRMANPQASFGADVLTRLAHASKSDEAALDLRDSVRRALAELVRSMLRELPPEGVRSIVLVANPPMHHLLLGLPLGSLARSPFEPAERASRFFDEAPNWLGCPRATLYLPPLVGGFVGSDALAMVRAHGRDLSGPSLFMDLGTNGEILLWADGAWQALSTAAGPAFEGGGSTWGMTAASGGIVDVRLQLGEARCTVLGDAFPLGLCGAGLISLVAELRRRGLLDGSGRLLAAADGGALWRDLLGEDDGGRFLRLAEGPRGSIQLSQADLRAFQLAKGAVTAGASMLLRHRGLDWSDLRAVFLAGAFAQALKVEDLVEIGLLPASLAPTCRYLGNAALAGAAELAGASPEEREALETFARAITVLRLEGAADFVDVFARSMALGSAAF